MENSETEQADNGPVQDQGGRPSDDRSEKLAAIVPSVLATRRVDASELSKILHDPLVVRARELAAKAQMDAQGVVAGEAAAFSHGVQRDRFTELAGLFSSLGEQLALAQASLVECELWRHKRQTDDATGDEMCHRAVSELLIYFCVSIGYGLTNITGRLLACDPNLHPVMLDVIGTTLPPFSDDRRDWLSCNSPTVKNLRKIGKSQSQQAPTVAAGVTTLVNSPAWNEAHRRRAFDFHRRRPNSHDVAGVPMRSLWEVTAGGSWHLRGAGPTYTDGQGLAYRTTMNGRAVLQSLVACLDDLVEVRDQIHKWPSVESAN